jgi:hypothetical protein
LCGSVSRMSEVLTSRLEDWRPSILRSATSSTSLSDAVWFEGTAEVAKRFSPAAVLLFGGASHPRGRST